MFKSFHKIKILWIETIVHSAVYGYAGKLDILAEIGKSTAVIDLKSVTTMQPATKIQLAGYAIAVAEMTGKKIERLQRWAVQLTPEGISKPYEYTERVDYSVFLSALQLYKFKQKHKIKKEENEYARELYGH